MKNLFPRFAQIVAVAACALTLGSCSRTDYAMLPKGSSYHGVTRVATPVPAPQTPAVATEVPEATAEAAATETVVSTVPVAPVVAPKAPRTAANVTTPAQATPAQVTAPAPKLNTFQRLALNKVTRKVDKLMAKASTVRQHDNTASVAKGGISGNLRIGIILLLVGLLVGILSHLVGTIIAIIGLIFIVLWLLDQA